MSNSDRVVRMPDGSGDRAMTALALAERQLSLSLWLIAALLGATAMTAAVGLFV